MTYYALTLPLGQIHVEAPNDNPCLSFVSVLREFLKATTPMAAKRSLTVNFGSFKLHRDLYNLPNCEIHVRVSGVRRGAFTSFIKCRISKFYVLVV